MAGMRNAPNADIWQAKTVRRAKVHGVDRNKRRGPTLQKEIENGVKHFWSNRGRKFPPT